jgi:glycosyltransferase involved in cell wall biosynthesis
MASFRRAVVVPNGIDLSKYSGLVRPLSPAPHIIWLRSFHRIYNPCLAIKVLALLRREMPGAHLTMIGPDDGDGSLQCTQRLAEELKVEKSVSFAGPIPKSDVPLWLNQGHIFLNTTNVDNSPVSVVEAMACGLPIVSTSAGGISDLIDHEQNGLLAPPENAEALAQHVRTILYHPELAMRLVEGGRRTAAARDWQSIVPRWEALLETVAAGARL